MYCPKCKARIFKTNDKHLDSPRCVVEQSRAEISSRGLFIVRATYKEWCKEAGIELVRAPNRTEIVRLHAETFGTKHGEKGYMEEIREAWFGPKWVALVCSAQLIHVDSNVRRAFLKLAVSRPDLIKAFELVSAINMDSAAAMVIGEVAKHYPLTPSNRRSLRNWTEEAKG